jgi:hypothetical protein
MKLCGPYPMCAPICDFCRSYKHFYSDDGFFKGTGWCPLKQEVMDAGDTCDEFYCADRSVGRYLKLTIVWLWRKLCHGFTRPLRRTKT